MRTSAAGEPRPQTQLSRASVRVLCVLQVLHVKSFAPLDAGPSGQLTFEAHALRVELRAVTAAGFAACVPADVHRHPPPPATPTRLSPTCLSPSRRPIFLVVASGTPTAAL